MIWMNLGASDNPLAVNKKPCGHREFPPVVTIESLEIKVEAGVHFLEFFRYGEFQTKFISIFVIFIRQYRKTEFMLIHYLFRIFT